MYGRIFGSALFILVLIGFACSPTLPPATPGGGFIVETLYTALGGPVETAAGVSMTATFVSNYQNMGKGNANPLSFTTNSSGLYTASGAFAPATWSFKWGSGGPNSACASAVGNPYQELASLGGVVAIECAQQNTLNIASAPVLGVNPTTFYTQAMPSSVTISGSGFSSAYGMPIMQYFDLNGNLVGQTTATSVGPGGSSMTGPPPSLSGPITGIYAGLAQNKTAGGSYALVGGGSTQVVAPPGYATFYSYVDYSSTPYGCLRFMNWMYYDASGHQVSQTNPPGVSLPLGGGYCGPGTFTNNDGYGNSFTVTVNSQVPGYLVGTVTNNGSTTNLPMQNLGP